MRENNAVVPIIIPTTTAMVKVTGTLSKSADVMKLVNNLVKAPELAVIMQQMSQGAPHAMPSCCNTHHFWFFLTQK